MNKTARTAILVASIAAIGDIDVVVMADFSGSMQTMMKKPGAEGGGAAGMISRASVLEGLGRQLVQDIMPYDSNGIDFISFGKNHKLTQNVTAENFKDAWATGAALDQTGTNLSSALASAFELCLPRAKSKKQVILCFTDGQPSDAPATITTLTKYSDDGRTVVGEVGICFIRIGTADGVAEFLTGLDTQLKSQNDITSWTTIEAFAQIDLGTKLGYTLGGSHDPAQYEALQTA